MKRYAHTIQSALAVAALATLSLTAPASAEEVDGQKVYRQLCTSCHGKDGKAQTPMGKKLGVKDLSKSQLELEKIIHQVKEGVKDEAGKQRMPSYKDRLNAEQLAALAEVVKSFRD